MTGTQTSNGLAFSYPSNNSALATDQKPYEHSMRFNVLITPDEAQSMLALSNGNRTPNKKDMRFYTDLMIAGEWVNTGEPIIISAPTADNPQGILINGHTRLQACVRAQKSFRCDIRYGVPYRAMSRIDSSRGRTPQNYLEIMGIKNTVKVSSVFNKYHAYVNKYSNSSDKPHPALLKDEMSDWWLNDRYADVSLIQKMQPIMNGACAQVAHILIRKAGCRQDVVDLFFDSLIKGVGLQEGNPILTLRNALMRPDVQNLARNTVSIHRYIATIIHMFNYWIAGKQCQKLYPVGAGNYVQPIIPPHARANNIEGGK